MLLLDPAARPIVGHRGAAGEEPENTVRSFDAALRQGADALEFDVRVSADGTPVVIHDATVDRTTDGTGPVASLTVRALGELNAGHGEPVPLLADVLARYPDHPLIVEIKETRAAEPALAVLHGSRDRVLVGSFMHEALAPFRRAGFAVAASRRQAATFWAVARTGLAAPRGALAAFTVPEYHGRLRVVDRRFVRAARRRGLPVHVWTVDEPGDARRLWVLGVSGIITNFPGRMRDALLQ